MATIVEEDSDAPTRVGLVILLIAVPAIALTLMATLALQNGSPRRQLASQTVTQPADSVTPASQRPSGGGSFTLFIMSSADAAKRLTELGETVPLPAWFAYAITPEEEAVLASAREHADWVRHVSGLPPILVVDLRLESTPAILGQR